MTGFADANAEALLQLWASPDSSDLSAHGREHAFWEYWRRVGEGSIAMDVDVFERALDSGYTVVPNVVCELAKRDRLSSEQLATLRSMRLSEVPREQARVKAALRARTRLRSLAADDRPASAGRLTELREDLLRDGLAWAILEVLPRLSAADADDLVAEVHSRGLFTRHQRHQIRSRASASTQRGGPSDSGG